MEKLNISQEQLERRRNLDTLLRSIDEGIIMDLAAIDPRDVSIEGIHMAKTRLRMARLGITGVENDQNRV